MSDSLSFSRVSPRKKVFKAAENLSIRSCHPRAARFSIRLGIQKFKSGEINHQTSFNTPLTTHQHFIFAQSWQRIFINASNKLRNMVNKPSLETKEGDSRQDVTVDFWPTTSLITASLKQIMLLFFPPIFFWSLRHQANFIMADCLEKTHWMLFEWSSGKLSYEPTLITTWPGCKCR